LTTCLRTGGKRVGRRAEWLKSEWRSGVEEGRVRSRRELVGRIALIGLALVVAWVLPIAWWARLAVVVGLLFIVGMIAVYPNVTASQRASVYETLSGSIDQLLIGLTADISSRYRASDPGESAVMAQCVLSYAFDVTVESPAAKLLTRERSREIERRASALHEIEEVSRAMSYLYAAILLRQGIASLPLSGELVSRASELGLYVPSAQDLCGSNDAHRCVQAIATFANAYLEAVSRPTP
jgi:hypothetical protein